MKGFLVFGFSLLSSLVFSLPFPAIAAAAEPGPRVLAAMRSEQSEFQRFCYSFIQDSNRGLEAARTCTEFSAERYGGNYSAASGDDPAELGTAAISRAHSKFCSAVGEYLGSGTTAVSDCEDWNRERAAVLLSHSGVSSRIARAEDARMRFCRSIANAGNSGEPSVFSERVSACFSMAKLATATYRAIFIR